MFEEILSVIFRKFIPNHAYNGLLPNGLRMNRRSFLVGTAGLIGGSLLNGCSPRSASNLNVYLLRGAVPAQTLNQFRQVLQQSASQPVLNFLPETQLQSLFSLLQTWKRQSPPSSPDTGLPEWLPFLGDRPTTQVADLVLLGNYWLQQAIQQQLIQPLDSTRLPSWATLAKLPSWQTLVTRDAEGHPDPKGKLWAAPYRWGTTLIVYRKDIFQKQGLQPPTDWNDLWRDDLRGHISLLDQPREVIGLTLKKLGQSYNITDLQKVPKLIEELQALHDQAKLYSSDSYLQPLLLGDTWLAVGWSSDVMPLLQRSGTIAAVVPASGTALWADVWVRPVKSDNTNLELAQKWINFSWEPTVANQISILSRATSPIVLTEDRQTLPVDIRNNPLLLPDAKTLAASEFLLPLPQATVDQYQAIWEKLRLRA